MKLLGLLAIVMLSACGDSGDCSCLEGRAHPYMSGVTLEQCEFVSEPRQGGNTPYEHCDCKAVGSGTPQTNIETCESLRMQGVVP